MHNQIGRKNSFAADKSDGLQTLAIGECTAASVRDRLPSLAGRMCAKANAMLPYWLRHC